MNRVKVREKVNSNQKVIRNMKPCYIPLPKKKGDPLVFMIKTEDKILARQLLTMEEYYIWDYFMTIIPYTEDEKYIDFVLYNDTFVYNKEKHIKGWGMSKPIYQKSIRGLIEKGYMKQWDEDPRLFLVYPRPVTE